MKDFEHMSERVYSRCVEPRILSNFITLINWKKEQRWQSHPHLTLSNHYWSFERQTSLTAHNQFCPGLNWLWVVRKKDNFWIFLAQIWYNAGKYYCDYILILRRQRCLWKDDMYVKFEWRCTTIRKYFKN